MKKLYPYLFTLVVIATLLAGCKINSPVYPNRDGFATGGGTTSTVIDGNGLPNGPENTAQIRLAPGQPIRTINTFTSVSKLAGTSTIGSFNETTRDAIDIFIIGAKAPGTYDLMLIEAFNLKTDFTHTGKTRLITFVPDTTNAAGNGKATGTFSADMVAETGKVYPHVIGSFNINK